MQITGKQLLSSAEGLMRDKKDGPVVGSKREENSTQETGRSVNTGSSIEARIMGLQADMARIQNSYSREQARQNYLNDPEVNHSELTYEGEPMFPEALAGQSVEGLRETVNTSVEELRQSLKSMAVEMENLFALNIQSDSKFSMDPQNLMAEGSLKDIDPNRVAHLTRNS